MLLMEVRAAGNARGRVRETIRRERRSDGRSSVCGARARRESKRHHQFLQYRTRIKSTPIFNINSTIGSQFVLLLVSYHHNECVYVHAYERDEQQ